MNEIAAEELLQHTEFVRRVALALSADEHGAEDLVQETWVTALTRERPDGSVLRSWLAGVARNLASQGRRGTTRRNAREAAAASAEGQPSTDDLVARMETHRRVVSAVLELPERAREVIVLRYFDGLPPREIAARLGVPVETVRTRVKRARERLREQLVDAHGSREAYVLAMAELGRRCAPGTASVATVPGLGLAGLTMALGAVAAVLAWPALASFPHDDSEVALELEQEAGSESGSTSGPGQGARIAHSNGTRRTTNLPAAAAVAPDERMGALVVRDVDGRELRRADGQLYLRPIDGTQREARLAPVRAGQFSLDGIPAGTVQVERATVLSDGEQRPVVFENALFELARDEPLVVTGLFLRDSILRVLDARTGAQLDGVRVLLGHGDSDQSHPGPHYPSSFCVKGARSPVLLPRTRALQSYWVTAESYTWSFLKVDHEAGGEREVRLEPAGRLEVQVRGEDPGLAIFLRVYQRQTQRVAASCSLDEGGFQAFDGLAAGEYVVRAEIGARDAPPVVLAEAQVVVPAAGTAQALLESRGGLVPPAVAVRGTLQLPPGHEELRISLLIRPAEGPLLRERDEKRIESSQMVRTDERGLLEWNAEYLTPGRYLFLVAPVQSGLLLNVPHTPVDDLRIEVPALHTVVVRAVDARTGEPVERGMMRWTRELPPEAGIDAWVHFGSQSGPEGTTLLVPAGPFCFAASGPNHGQRFMDAYVGTGPLELTLELPRHIPLEVVLKDGETVIPWVRGMTCSFRPAGAAELQPGGSFGDGRMFAHIEGPGRYEVVVGRLDGFRQPDPIVVAIDGDAPAPVVVSLER